MDLNYKSKGLHSIKGFSSDFNFLGAVQIENTSFGM